MSYMAEISIHFDQTRTLTLLNTCDQKLLDMHPWLEVVSHFRGCSYYYFVILTLSTLKLIAEGTNQLKTD